MIAGDGCDDQLPAQQSLTVGRAFRTPVSVYHTVAAPAMLVHVGRQNRGKYG